jgi:hypothetical protein
MPRREPTPSLAELELSDAHQGQAFIDGNDECTCRLCGRVRRYYDHHTSKAVWMSGGAV